jgi:AcrR family transcriptional regulator
MRANEFVRAHAILPYCMNIPPKKFRERTIRDAKCALILDAARTLFAQKGYWETRLEDVAAIAGFSKASLYNYYVDKEAIFLSIVIIENDEMLQEINSVVGNPGTFIKALQSILEIVFNRVSEDFGIMVNAVNFQNMITMHANMLKHKGLIEQFIASANHLVEVLKGLIRRARQAGEIATDLSDEALAKFIGILIRGAIFDWNSTTKKTAIDAIIMQLLAFVKQGAAIR